MTDNPQRASDPREALTEDEPVFFRACGRCDGSGEVGGVSSWNDPYAMAGCPDCGGSGLVEGEPDSVDEEDWWESLQ